MTVSAPVRALIAPRGSLKTHLFIFAAALVLPLLLVVGLALDNITSSERSKTREQLIRAAKDVSGDVDREIYGYLTVLKTLSNSSLLANSKLAEFQERAKAALAERRVNVLLLDTSLQQLLNTRVPYGTPLPKTADEESANIVLDTGLPYVSDVFKGTVSKQYVVNIEVPVTFNNKIKYILLITLEVERFREILSGAKGAEDYVITLSDREGRVISDLPIKNGTAIPMKADRLKSKADPLITQFRDDEGRNSTEAAVWSGVSGWRTTVSASKAQLDAVLWTSVRWFCVAIALAALLTIVLGTLIGKRLADPISEIKSATVALARGDRVIAHDLPLSEANEVMSSLSRTSALIASRTARLQESEERSREQVRQIDTLMHELAHRNKNQLSMILAMARQLAATSETVKEFEEKFVQRIMATAAAQDLVLQGSGAGVPLHLLLENQLKPFVVENSPQVLISGPEVQIIAEAARSVGMAFHELATNATKYGALKSPEGRIVVNWSVDELERRLTIIWQEEDGPNVKTPERSGFGRTIIERFVAQTLKADVTYSFDPAGVRWTMTADEILI